MQVPYWLVMAYGVMGAVLAVFVLALVARVEGIKEESAALSAHLMRLQGETWELGDRVDDLTAAPTPVPEPRGGLVPPEVGERYRTPEGHEIRVVGYNPRLRLASLEVRWADGAIDAGAVTLEELRAADPRYVPIPTPGACS